MTGARYSGNAAVAVLDSATPDAVREPKGEHACYRFRLLAWGAPPADRFDANAPVPAEERRPSCAAIESLETPCGAVGREWRSQSAAFARETASSRVLKNAP